jgi:hypothetical protein
MQTKKLTHSKYKNTGLIFELLVRKLTQEVLDKKTGKATREIIERYFGRNTGIAKEYALYSTILSMKNRKPEFIHEILSECRGEVKKFNFHNLKREKFHLVKELKELFGEGFFKLPVPEYKTFASIYKLFALEEDVHIIPALGEVAGIKNYLVETLASTQPEKIKPFKKRSVDEDIDNTIAFKLMVERFNKKYKGLSGPQKNILRMYVSGAESQDAFKNALLKEIASISAVLTASRVTVKDRPTQVKITYVSKLTEGIKRKISNGTITDKVITQVLLYSELKDELLEK